ncbi:hypothetical protein ACFPRL_13440 [Pseudoclavibacter helvolus]
MGCRLSSSCCFLDRAEMRWKGQRPGCAVCASRPPPSRRSAGSGALLLHGVFRVLGGALDGFRGRARLRLHRLRGARRLTLDVLRGARGSVPNGVHSVGSWFFEFGGDALCRIRHLVDERLGHILGF